MSDFDLYVFEEGQAEQQALREAAQAAHEAQAAGPQPSAEDLPHSEYVSEPLPEPGFEPGPVDPDARERVEGHEKARPPPGRTTGRRHDDLGVVECRLHCCPTCSWIGVLFSYRLLEAWNSSQPPYWEMLATCPVCGARLTRR